MSNRLYLGLAGLAVAISVFKVPRFPIGDPALFEYYGKALLHGGALYAGNLIDNKLPSVYLINALWQALFGSNYFLHACAEAAFNLGSIALFAAALRRAGIEAWALGALLFAVFLSLPFPYFDTVYHYAIFFVVLGIFLRFHDRDLWAGVSIAAATTFCFPAALTCVPILMQRPRPARIRFLAGFFGFAVLVALGMTAIFGPHVFVVLTKQWQAYVAHVDWSEFSQHAVVLLASGMGAGILAMLALLLLVVRRSASGAARFALVWLACALGGFVISPQFVTDRFLLPSVPAFAMAIASYNPALDDVKRRPIVAIVALALLLLTAINSARDANKVGLYAEYVQSYGAWVRASVGSGAPMFVRDWAPEVPLAADALMLRRYDDAGRLVVPASTQLLVLGPFEIPDAARRGEDLTLPSGSRQLLFKRVCPRDHPLFLILYAVASKTDAFSCMDEPRATAPGGRPD